MKKLLYSFAAIAISLLIANCGGKGGNSPSDIEKSIYTKMQKGNYEKAAELLVKNLDSNKEATTEEQAQLIKAFGEKAKQSAEAKGGIKSFEVVEENIAEDGQSGTVTTKVVFNDGTDKTETTKYVKKETGWKISMGK